MTFKLPDGRDSIVKVKDSVKVRGYENMSIEQKIGYDFTQDVMIHQPLGGAQGQAEDIIIQAEKIKSIRQRMNEILAERTGQSLKKIQKDTDKIGRAHV